MPTNLGKAYVQIIPSAQGIQGMLGQALGGEAESAGHSAGETLGGKLVGTIKKVIAAAGIGKALALAITEGAALEQSLGGVETLFRENADTIKQYAASAYATAGLSANAYMETVTGFSASLLQGLKGDTAAAAEVANMALIDMADNANKMGTDMQSIQTAYQGFAKQNYTMLDNLKLGYGGTKTEMQRLLADAQKITGVKYNIDNLADVYTAIHVIQGGVDELHGGLGDVNKGLGITGTTAKEAATTISGSMAAMKAAFSNVLGSLTIGQDVTPALEALAQTTTTFISGNLLPAVWNMLSALPGALVTFIRSLAPQLTNALSADVIPQILSAISDFPQLVDTGTQLAVSLIRNLGAGLQQEIPNLLSQALPMLLELSGVLRANFGTIVDAGIDLILSLAQGLINGLPVMVEYIPQIISNLAGLINDNAPKILDGGKQLIIMLGKGLIQAAPTIWANMGNILQAAADVITAINWLDLGSKVIHALGSGFIAIKNGLKKAMESTFSEALKYIKNLPKQAVTWGKDMISGFVNGILGSIGNVINAVKNVASAIASYLHFSRPDIGPLRDYEQWMPDMIDGLIEGINANRWRLESAAQICAQTITDQMSATSLRSGLVSLMQTQTLAWQAPSPAIAAPSGGNTFNQTIYTHDSLSASEMTREAQAFLERCKWQIP